MKHPIIHTGKSIAFPLIYCVVVSVALASCTTDRPSNRSAQTTSNRYTYARIMMGSRCTITLYAQTEPKSAEAARLAFEEIAGLERVLTDYDPNSEAMRIARAPIGQWHPVSDALIDVLTLSKKFHTLSDGAFDPTVGAYTHLWRSTRSQDRIPDAAELAHAGASTGFENLDVDNSKQRVRFRASGMILDFGGIGKGYAADRALAVVTMLGYPSAMVNLGGDLAIGDPPPDRQQGWDIEIQSGIGQTENVDLFNSGIATSGDAERFFSYQGIRYSHILDPRSGIGMTEQRAVTVIAQDATTADALASIVSVLGQPGIDAVLEEFPDAKIRLIIGE